jgi:hypothetical protein
MSPAERFKATLEEVTLPSLGANPLLQLRVLRFGLLQDGDVGVGVLPERKKILIRRACLYGVASSSRVIFALYTTEAFLLV